MANQVSNASYSGYSTCMYVCMFVFSQSCGFVLSWTSGLDSLPVNLTTRVRIPLNVLFLFVCFSFFFFFFLLFFVLFFSLLAWTDICAAELATWGVGPDV